MALKDCRGCLFTLLLLLYACTSEDSVSVSPLALWNSSNPNNTAVIVDMNVDAVNQQVSSDGNGGVIVVWQDNRDGVWNIYAQHLDKVGAKLWNENGVAITQALDPQENPQLLADGKGGVYICWQGMVAGASHYNIFAQHLDDKGDKVWSSDNIIVSGSTINQTAPQLVSDSSGIIIGWLNDPSNQAQAFAHKLDFNGAPIWPAAKSLSSDYIVTTGVIAPVYLFYLASDDSGGVFGSWTGSLGLGVPSSGLHHANSGGDLTTTSFLSPINVPRLGGVYSLGLVSDQSNGVYTISTRTYNIGTTANPQFDTRIVVEHLSVQNLFLWNDAIEIATQPTFWGSPAPYFFSTKAVGSNDGAVFIVWQISANSLYIQKMNYFGDLLWQQGGVLLTDSNTVSNPFVISDDFGGAIVSWEQGNGNEIDVMAQRLNADGKKLWGDGNLTISSAKDKQQVPVLVGNGNGGAIVVWQDYRNGLVKADIYAQGISANGK